MAFAVVFFRVKTKLYSIMTAKKQQKAQITKQNKERSSEKNHLETIVIHAHI